LITVHSGIKDPFPLGVGYGALSLLMITSETHGYQILKNDISNCKTVEKVS
jgi:hypothetical protein